MGDAAARVRKATKFVENLRLTLRNIREASEEMSRGGAVLGDRADQISDLSAHVQDAKEAMRSLRLKFNKTNAMLRKLSAEQNMAYLVALPLQAPQLAERFRSSSPCTSAKRQEQQPPRRNTQLLRTALFL